MTSISIEFQLNDQQPILANLPQDFTLDDFRRAADNIYNHRSFLYSFVCHGKELDLSDEKKFNNCKALITSVTTIFTIEHFKCFLPETLILRADQREIRISDVQLVVQDIFKHEVDEYMELQLGENQLYTTREHPLFVGNDNFSSLDNLRASDSVYRLMDGNLLSTKITSIQTITAPATVVYNLSTTPPHTYFANLIAVHNKFGKTFVNLTKGNSPKRIEWNSSAPNWCIARSGICLEGKCSNPSCLAHKELVIINIGIREFDLLTESYKISKCPECSKYVEPVTCALNNCMWRWIGLKQSKIDAAPTEVSEDWMLTIVSMKLLMVKSCGYN
ncbi:unnamed protein product [Rotaria magnacalcarata]|uniref:Uncharacterized protein n=3 Tax=Rotaria magnacalcarata TaxID=392030 RepID=A0A820C4Y8_9BILA|nr:unnamed protein product [Rotaria magnacalcarata]